MSVHFLSFGGNWENEGKFCLLETKKSIIIIAVGKGHSSVELQEQQIGHDYLKENRKFIEKSVIDKFAANPRRLLLN